MKQIGSCVAYGLGGLMFLLFAFVGGVQKNFFFGAVTFVSFFTIAIILFHQIGRILNKEDEDNKKARR